MSKVPEQRNSQTEESQLLQQAIKRNPDAFGRLYDMYVDRVYRHIYYRVGSIADAEDLTQQVFLKAWEAIDRFRKTTRPFLAWLMTISRNLVIDFYRTRKNQVPLEAEGPVDTRTANPEQVAEAHWEQARLRRAISQLHPDQQQVVVLRFLEGFRNAEIAAATGKSEGAVRVALHRALVKLRDILQKEPQ